MKKYIPVLAAALAVGFSQANAITVFEDNFDSENGGNGVLNYSSFTNWSVSDGTVDLIPVGSQHDFLPGNGLYVDMDGSTNNAGVMTSKFLNLVAGSYSLSYYLAGNQRNGSSEQVDVGVEVGVTSTFHSLAQNDGFQQFFLNFDLAVGQTINITFGGQGGDNIGMLLDNVKLERRAVPDAGATAGLLGLGLLGLAAIRKRLK